MITSHVLICMDDIAIVNTIRHRMVVEGFKNNQELEESFHSRNGVSATSTLKLPTEGSSRNILAGHHSRHASHFHMEGNKSLEGAMQNMKVRFTWICDVSQSRHWRFAAPFSCSSYCATLLCCLSNNIHTWHAWRLPFSKIQRNNTNKWSMGREPNFCPTERRDS